MGHMTVNRTAAVLSIACSAIACAIAVTNIAENVPPTTDEGASAHIWQLLMGAQLPLILLFAVTANWRSRYAGAILGIQLLALVLACAPVFLAGY